MTRRAQVTWKLMVGYFAKDDDDKDPGGKTPDDFPPVDACVAIALVESVICFAGAYVLDW